MSKNRKWCHDLKRPYGVKGKGHLCLEYITCDPLICTVNHPRVIVSNQMEGFNRIQKVKQQGTYIISCHGPCFNIGENKGHRSSQDFGTYHIRVNPLLHINAFEISCICKYYGKWSICFIFHVHRAQWLSGRVLDSRPKGRRFEPHQRHCVVVLEQDTFILA